MQKLLIIGNLTRDPELSETKSGISVCRFTVAVNRRQSAADAEPKTDYFNVTVWRGLGETAAKYLHKGNKVFVSGELNARTYETNDGETRLSLDVTAQDIEFLTPKKADDDDYGGYAPEPIPPAHSSSGKRQAKLQSFDDDDIPF